MKYEKPTEKDLLELKQRLLERSKPKLEEIKAKNKNKSELQKKEEIKSAVSSLVAIEVFDKELNDKEFNIFKSTFYYMLYYTFAIEEVLSELYSRI